MKRFIIFENYSFLLDLYASHSFQYSISSSQAIPNNLDQFNWFSFA